MESPTGSTDNPDDLDDVPIPCKGCGEILEEGKAYELAGHRWHMDCFRCHRCLTFLDSDANLLLLGDGSLICNNCTYSCTSCGSKIEDLAILTGDQAFCEPCFKCRNCKRLIDNLRYARTSQGIFCMECHESLMARRRKKTGRYPNQRQKQPNPSMHLDKSLPSLPPSMMPEGGAVPQLPPSEIYPDPATDTVVRARSSEDREVPQDNFQARLQSSNQDNLILPSSTYNSKRQSVASHRSDASGGEEFLIPVAFDPTPSARQSPHVGSPSIPKASTDGPIDRFNRNNVAGPSANPSDQTATAPSQHIAYQDKRRVDSDTPRRRQDGESTSKLSLDDSVHRRTESQTGHAGASADISKSPDVVKGKQPSSSASTLRTESESRTAIPNGGPVRQQSSGMDSVSSQSTSPNQRSSTEKSNANPAQPPHPKRGDSLESKLHHTLRKDVPTQDPMDKTDSTSRSTTSTDPRPAYKTTNSSTSRRSNEIASPAQSPHNRTKSGSVTSRDIYSSPRSSQQSPNDNRPGHSRSDSTGNIQPSDPLQPASTSSAGLLRYSAGGDFSFDEDMARILGDDNQNQESFLRRVSNSVRHGRSFSDKGSRLSREHKWPKSPTSSGIPAQDISSPSTSAPENRDELTWFKNELKRERQKVIDKDRRISELESSLNATVSIKQVNTELREKRSTMVFLDAQKEVVLRELEVWKEHIAAEKQNNHPLDLAKMGNSVLRELAESIQNLKDSFRPQIEELIQKRNDLLEELTNLGKMKDKCFQEFEQLSHKNAQLAELNNQLVHQIQELYKANSTSTNGGGKQPQNGLGIYSHHKDKSTASLEVRDGRSVVNEQSPANTAPGGSTDESDPVTVIQGPQVISIRKAQPKKFTWKKGQTVAKGVTKGIKGAFSSQRDGQFAETAPYGATSQDGNVTGPLRSQTQDPSRQGFGFFGNQKTKPTPWKTQSNGSSPALVEPTALFGGELEQRLEIEKGAIPIVVIRCIEEVELRGMDVEGIYRKSGGSSQVQQIREGFERAGNGTYDISDPDLDIHAVTSAVKQYFRVLPTPLVTYPVYDKLLDANNVTPHSARIEFIQASLQELPRVHKDVLEFLVFHLKRVVDREKENLMTSLNIAVVFAPTIMRPESLSREMTDVQKKNDALQFMVDNCQEIFMGA
ncbi:hypothetical protein FQN57_003863 [Myotisia sp. PD_48]|nr:hypothetical protein FQN57_003863 [Myotisia sp. PD_48]